VELVFTSVNILIKYVHLFSKNNTNIFYSFKTCLQNKWIWGIIGLYPYSNTLYHSYALHNLCFHILFLLIVKSKWEYVFSNIYIIIDQDPGMILGSRAERAISLQTIITKIFELSTESCINYIEPWWNFFYALLTLIFTKNKTLIC
jgi:hypothetical protein